MKLLLAALPILFLPVVVQAQLDEQVPYQGDTLLTNPTQLREDGNGRVFMDCDWQTMVSMIRDLEERIAGEVETDTLYGDYRTKELPEGRNYMRYECVVLRDSILSLQVAYDAVLAPRVTLDPAVILSDISAALSASFTGSGVASSGFEWAVDPSMTSPQSGGFTGATSPIADTLTVFDPGKVYYFTAYAVKDAEYFYGDTLALLTMPGITTDAASLVWADAATLNSTFEADSIDAQGFVWGQLPDLSDGLSVAADTTGGSTAIAYELTGLATGEAHYFSAFASNASGTMFGDTLSLVTRPGVTTEAANAISMNAATLNATFAADSITAQGFVWGVPSDLSDGTDVASDTTAGSSAFDFDLTGLIPGTVHHFSAHATNASGITYGDTLALLTTPGITTEQAADLVAESATLKSTFSADSITAQGFVWGLQSDLSDGLSVSADTTGGSTAIEYALSGLTGLTTYYYSAFATNASGTSRGDTLSFTTLTPITDLNIHAAVNLWVSDEASATATYGHISDWKTGAVTDMNSLFFGKETFNDDISNWDVSNVTNAEKMFMWARVFNQDIGTWNVGNFEKALLMFAGAWDFNQDIGDWDVSNVEVMTGMFGDARAFNQDIGGWDVSSVTSMTNMFGDADAFDQYIGDWNVSNVTQMAFMFQKADVFNQDISAWDVSNVTDMVMLFLNVPLFNQNIGGWDVSSVTNMKEMFKGAAAFNQDIGGWNVGNVTTMESMFEDASAFNYDLGDWNVSSVITMESMFEGASAFNGDIGNWNVSNVTTMKGMFQGASAFNGDIGNWNVSNVTTMLRMFQEASAFNGDIGNWNVGNVTTMVNMFYDASVFNQNIGSWNVGNVTTMLGIFGRASAFNADITTWNVGNVTNMQSAFSEALAFDQNIGNWNMSSVTVLTSMFYGTTSFNQDIGTWDVSNATTMYGMFEASAFNRDIGGWDVSNVSSMTNMFSLAPLFNQDISGWDVSSVTQMSFMFSQASAFSQDLSDWCVHEIATEPMGFGYNFTKPLWGTCPIALDSVALLSDTSAVLSASFIGSWPQSSGFAWASDAAMTSPQTGSNTGGTSPIVDTLVGLNSGAVHYFNAYAERGGVYRYSDTLSLLTTPGIATNAADELGLNGGTLNATFAADSITAQGFVWGLQSDLSDGVTVGVDTTEGSTAIELVLSDLTLSTTYYFSAFATNAAGTSFGDTLSFSTLTPITNGNIHDAVNLWVSDEASAAATYGHISDWNTVAVTDMNMLFYNKATFNDDIGGWDVSNVTAMRDMFRRAGVFDQNIGGWDVSNVTDMQGLFYDATAFNQDLSLWDVSSVTTMQRMFSGAEVFNQDIGGWIVSSVTDMGIMLFEAAAFNQDIGGWDVSNVTSMNSLFSKTDAFNQDIGGWDVSSVSYMGDMFSNAAAFNQDITGWNVSNVANMKGMFIKADAFNQAIGIWNVSNVTDMSSMFYGASVFDQAIGNWDVSSVTTMRNMFRSASAFDQAIGGWNVSNVTDMEDMFYESTFNQPIGGWNVSSVTSMHGMFERTTAFNQDIGTWNVSSATDLSFMFYLAPFFNQNIGNWNVSSATNMQGMFYSATTFNQPIGGWDVSNVTDISFMFAGDWSFDQPIGTWNVSNVTDMQRMFSAASVFNQDIGDWNVSNVTSMMEMFKSADRFNQAIGDWDVTYVTSMHGMFQGGDDFNQDIGAWTVSGVTDMENMFYLALAFDQAIGGWDVSSVTTMAKMFDNALAFNQDIGAWNVGNVASMEDMFRKTLVFDQNIGNWDVSSVTNMSRMFNQADAFTQNLSAWCVNQIATEPSEFGSGFTQPIWGMCPNPPSVSSVAASDLSLSGATLNGTVDGDGDDVVTATGFRWGQASDLSDAVDLAGDATSGAFTGLLTGLADGTTYYFSAFATNGLGTAHGDTLSFTTPALAVFVSCGDELGYQGYNYGTVQIGSDCWFVDNLRSENYNDGNGIALVENNSDWYNTTVGARSAYNNDVSNVTTFGMLYNGPAVATGMLCPSGWHVPASDELTALLAEFGGANVAALDLKSSQSDTPAWDGDNTSGFSALPGGTRQQFGTFIYGSLTGKWWTTTPHPSTAGYSLSFSMSLSDNNVSSSFGFDKDGNSIRCIKDPVTASVTTVAASDVSLTGATLNGTVEGDGGDAVTATGFRWGQASDLSDAVDLAGSTTGGPFTGSLTGLADGTTYYFSAFATNGPGTAYGDTLSFTTPALAVFASCGDDLGYEGYNYGTVQIGSQCWFVNNLRSENYSDGNGIALVENGANWYNTTTGARCAYDNDDSNVSTFGMLYNAQAVATGMLCPSGWHVPSSDELASLNAELGGVNVSGLALKSSQSDTPAWDGDNTSGFSALPSGSRNQFGSFIGDALIGRWWTTTPHPTSAGYYLSFSLTTGYDYVTSSFSYEEDGNAIRCLKNAATASAPTVTTVAASDVAETGATLNGTVEGDGVDAVTATGFRWGQASDLSDAVDLAGNVTTRTFTGSLTGLADGATYYFSAFATNGQGTAHGDTLSFTTPAVQAALFNCGDAVSYQGYDYATIESVGQCWFAENLQSTLYNDGSAIPTDLSDAQWGGTTSGAVAAYGDDESNVAIYGRLYNYPAVLTGKLCPVGWHVPGSTDWGTLAYYIGAIVQVELGPSLKSSEDDVPSWDGTNSSGFSGLPGGQRLQDGTYQLIGDEGFWYVADDGSTGRLVTGNSNLLGQTGNPAEGQSIRCIKDVD